MKAYTRPTAKHLIDTIDDATGLTRICGETLEQVRERFPDAILVDVDESCAEKQREQLAPVTWAETDEETYWEMLECLPPETMAGGAFLVGEPMDHLASTGESTYECIASKALSFYVASRPVTVAEFNQLITTRITVAQS